MDASTNHGCHLQMEASNGCLMRQLEAVHLREKAWWSGEGKWNIA